LCIGRGGIRGCCDVDLRAARLEESERALCSVMDLSYLAIPEQVHGREYYDLRSAGAIGALLARQGGLVKGARCDALLAASTQVLKGSRIGFGVLSADCVPVLVRARGGWAAIHAGWRGLANGVIANTLGALEGVEEAAVFAAAGGLRYEVGQEVIDAIGPSAVYSEALKDNGADSKGDKGGFLLDTAQTALKQLRAVIPSIRAEAAGICTISDLRFHSFRRDGERCGRGLTFVAPGV